MRMWGAMDGDGHATLPSPQQNSMPIRATTGTTPQFFLPHNAGLEDLPTSSADYWTWISGRRGISEGRYTWTLLTYLRLREAGVDCSLAFSMPTGGIVVAHRDFLPLILRPRPHVFLVCIKPDRKEHTWAHHYVVQNASDSIFRGPNGARATAVKHWPQPSLLPRDARRDGVCENVAYFGRLVNLAPELADAAWAEQLAGLGFRWQASIPSERWHDYREIDVTVSVRSFGELESDDPVLDPNSKPPSKLVNSWHAGVPAIVGRESSFRNIRRSPLDFIEVGSIAELTAALTRLREDRDLYRQMVDHGRERAVAFSNETIAGEWAALFRDAVVPEYERWMARSAVSRQAANVLRAARFLAAPRNIASIRIYRG